MTNYQFCVLLSNIWFIAVLIMDGFWIQVACLTVGSLWTLSAYLSTRRKDSQ